RRATSPEETHEAIRAGLDDCIRTGTTLVGDIAGGGASWRFLAASGIRATVYYEVLGLPEDRARRAWETFLVWLNGADDTRRCRGGASPHARYSVSKGLYWKTYEDTPAATHLAESLEELELLSRHSGPFVEFLRRVGVWAPEQLMGGTTDVIGSFETPVP